MMEKSGSKIQSVIFRKRRYFHTSVIRWWITYVFFKKIYGLNSHFAPHSDIASLSAEYPETEN